MGLRFHLAFLLGLLFVAPAYAEDAKPVTVFAAASLSDVLQKVGEAYRQGSSKAVVFSFAASSALARQIEASSGGADIFISADEDWMNYLGGKGLIVKQSRKDLLGNRLVLIAPAASAVKIKLKAPLDLATPLGDGKLSLADPESVPAGKYAKAALTKLGAWDGVAGNIASAENVRVALAFVARAEAPLGVVYETDAKAEPKVRIVATFPASSHPAILYPAALTKDARAEAKSFLDYLKSAKAAAIFKAAGFSVLK